MNVCVMFPGDTVSPWRVKFSQHADSASRRMFPDKSSRKTEQLCVLSRTTLMGLDKQDNTNTCSWYIMSRNRLLLCCSWAQLRLVWWCGRTRLDGVWLVETILPQRLFPTCLQTISLPLLLQLPYNWKVLEAPSKEHKVPVWLLGLRDWSADCMIGLQGDLNLSL